MSEELLRAIVQLFAIVARERITDAERAKIKEFLSIHLNRDATNFYLRLFDDFCKDNQLHQVTNSSLDEATQQFVDEWSNIMKIIKQVNQALTMPQKLVLVVKIIELVYTDFELSERQENLIFYIGQALKIPQSDVDSLKSFVMGQDIDELASRNILIIDEGSGNYPGPRLIEKDLTGLIAILRLNDGELYFIKYLGITTLYLNSILLKSRKIDVLPTGSTIRGDKVGPIYYSDIVGKFLIDEGTPGITFTGDHLFYHFRTGRAGIQNVNIAEQGGKLIGLMGASGSGKSTLLNVLNGTERPSSGKIMINGIDIYEQPEKVKGIIGYVPQDDLLIDDLTVYQNLYYAASLCFKRYSNEQLDQLVQRLLINLGLIEIKDLIVGSILKKTISGGQRKRINIALELMREPTILFVDEPTSGLSSRDSENIMDLLKELSLRGKMVFVVIHQPSSDIYKMFDSLLILDVGGFQIYYGNPVEAVVYFRDIINAANKDQGACPECGNINPEQIFNIIETKVVNEYGRLTHTRKISPGQWYQYFKQKTKIPRINHQDAPLPVAQEIAGWARQFRIFLTRDLLSKLANNQYLTINLIQGPLLALFIAFMVRYFNESHDESYTFYANPNIPVYFFMCVVVSLFFGLVTSAEEIFRDRKILKRERFLQLSWSSYLTSKIAVMFFLSAIQTALFLLVGNFILGIPLGEFRFWLLLFSTSCFANLLGLNISSAFNSAVTIYILIPILIIPQLLLSGVVISFDRFNPLVGKPTGVPLIGEVMASKWAFEGLMVTQFKDNPYEKQFYDLDIVIAESEYKRVYLYPELERELVACFNNRRNWTNKSDPTLGESFAILRTELGYELQSIGAENFPELKDLDYVQFDSTTYQKTAAFIQVLKEFYLRRANKAMAAKEKLTDSLTSTPEREKLFRQKMNTYSNDAVADAVKNVSTPDRIVRYKTGYVQKIYPIYKQDHRPESWVDFSANLYQPTKHFGGRFFDTYWFNTAVIWVMSLLLYVALYFNLLRRLITRFEWHRKYRIRK